MNRRIAAAIVTAALFGATACTSTADAEPTPARTVTTTPEPTPEPSDTAVAEVDILDDVWSETPDDAKTSMCDGFLLNPDFVLDNFMDQLETEGYDMDRSTARKFFNTRCAALD